MLNGSNYITSISINTSIFAIAGYYVDNDENLQHVIAAEKDGNVYEVHWDASGLALGYHPAAKRLGYFGNSLVAIAGFFTPDDNYHHAVGITNDRTLHELYFRVGEAPNRRDPLYHINSLDPNKGAASFYSPGDNLRHVVLVDSLGNPIDISWNAEQAPRDDRITIPPNDSQVASISGFLSSYDANPNTRHIIVARNDTGQIYDIDYPDQQNIPQDIRGQDNVYVKTTFNERVKNVTAFFSSDNKYRHIVVLNQANLLKDHAYEKDGGNLRSTQLTSSALANNVADITSFYNAHDHLRHVLYATQDGNLYEITYTSQG